MSMCSAAGTFPSSNGAKGRPCCRLELRTKRLFQEEERDSWLGNKSWAYTLFRFEGAQVISIALIPALARFFGGGQAVPGRNLAIATHVLQSPDGAIQLARKTEWRELRPEVWAGLGQRVFSSDQGEHALMDVRDIVFTASEG